VSIFSALAFTEASIQPTEQASMCHPYSHHNREVSKDRNS